MFNVPVEQTSPTILPINYVFVDFENVQEIEQSVIGAKSIYFTLLLGAKQGKLDAGLVERLVENAVSVQLIRLSSSGKNALDFALAYYVGRAVMADPTAYFHIVSKDKGFDPLIDHLRSRHLRVTRHDDFSTLTFTARPKQPTGGDGSLQMRTLEHLRKNDKNRPKKRKTLESHLQSFTRSGENQINVAKLIQNLSAAGHISICDNGSVSYFL